MSLQVAKAKIAGGIKLPHLMFRNSAGELDSMWTLTLISFWVTTMAYILSWFAGITVGDVSLVFREFDGLGYAAIVMIPLVTAYFGRRYTKAQNDVADTRIKTYAELQHRKFDVQQKIVEIQATVGRPDLITAIKNVVLPDELDVDMSDMESHETRDDAEGTNEDV